MFSSSLLRRARPSQATALAARNFSASSRASLARMQIIGRLAAEPEIVPTSTGRELVRFVVGTKVGRGDTATTSWFNIVSFDEEGPRRDYLLSLQKGTLLHVEADARMSTYENDSGKHKKLDLIQRNIEVLQRGRRDEAAASEEPAAQ